MGLIKDITLPSIFASDKDVGMNSITISLLLSNSSKRKENLNQFLVLTPVCYSKRRKQK